MYVCTRACVMCICICVLCVYIYIYKLVLNTVIVIFDIKIFHDQQNITNKKAIQTKYL